MCTSPLFIVLSLSPLHLSTEMSASHSGENIQMNYIIKQSRKSPKSYFIHVLHPLPFRIFLRRFSFFAKKHFEKCEIVNEFSFRSLSEPSPLVAKFLCFSYYFECAGRMKKSDWGRERENKNRNESTLVFIHSQLQMFFIKNLIINQTRQRILRSLFFGCLGYFQKTLGGIEIKQIFFGCSWGEQRQIFISLCFLMLQEKYGKA